MENHGKWKNKIQAWKSHGKWKFGKKSWKSHGILIFYKCISHFVWEKCFDYLQFWHTMSHLYLWKILHAKSKKLDSATPSFALDRIAVAVKAVKSVLNVFFRPQPKFWRMPIVVIRRVRPSVRPSVVIWVISGKPDQIALRDHLVYYRTKCAVSGRDIPWKIPTWSNSKWQICGHFRSPNFLILTRFTQHFFNVSLQNLYHISISLIAQMSLKLGKIRTETRSGRPKWPIIGHYFCDMCNI